MKTVEQARKAGFKVRVGHFRFDDESAYYFSVDKKADPDVYLELDAELINPIYPRGGKTVVSISKDDKDCFGQAFCSLEDNYCKKTGVALALSRAMEVWNSL